MVAGLFFCVLQIGTGLIRRVGQSEPVPFQAPRCDEADILGAIAAVAMLPRQSVASQGDGASPVTQGGVEQAFTASEIATLRALIAEGVWKREVIKVMPGYSGRKYGQYSTYYEELRDKLESEQSEGAADVSKET